MSGKETRKQNNSAGTQAPALCVYLCEGPKTLKAAGHSCSKAALPPQGCEQQAVLGGVGLVSPVGPAKLLNGLVSGPGQLQGEMDPPLLVLGTPALLTHYYTD